MKTIYIYMYICIDIVSWMTDDGVVRVVRVVRVVGQFPCKWGILVGFGGHLSWDADLFCNMIQHIATRTTRQNTRKLQQRASLQTSEQVYKESLDNQTTYWQPPYSKNRSTKTWQIIQPNPYHECCQDTVCVASKWFGPSTRDWSVRPLIHVRV